MGNKESTLKRNGFHRVEYADGAYYEGTYKDDFIIHGIHYLSPGYFYKGGFHILVKHGQGKLSLPCGDWYEGEFDQDNFRGSGRIQIQNSIYGIQCQIQKEILYIDEIKKTCKVYEATITPEAGGSARAGLLTFPGDPVRFVFTLEPVILNIIVCRIICVPC
jgi:hypothetical protein